MISRLQGVTVLKTSECPVIHTVTFLAPLRSSRGPIASGQSEAAHSTIIARPKSEPRCLEREPEVSGVTRILPHPPVSSFVPSNSVEPGDLISGTPDDNDSKHFVSSDGKATCGVWRVQGTHPILPL